MNKKTFITSLILIVVFLMAQLVLKFIFPEYFILMVEEPNLVRAGNFIMAHPPLYCITLFILGVISDYLFFGATCQSITLNHKLWIIIGVYNLALASLYTFASTFLAQYSYVVTAASMCYLLCVTRLFTNSLHPITVTLSLTHIVQILVLLIRNASVLLTELNVLSTTLITFESYLVNAFCFVLFNKKFNKEEI